MNRTQVFTLYFCHALSTWNARTYEFAAVLFTAAAYPSGLRQASIIGITTSLAAICFASTLGRWIDNAPSRLQTLVTTITVNRCAIISACLLWFFIVGGPNQSVRPRDLSTYAHLDDLQTVPFLESAFKTSAFTLILSLGIIESLSRKANLISIERDWVPLLAPPAIDESSIAVVTLTQVNATMVRIDIICKLLSPIAISWLLSSASARTGVAGVLLSNLLSYGLEMWTAKKLWNSSDSLRQPKQYSAVQLGPTHREGLNSIPRVSVAFIVSSITSWYSGYCTSLKLYFRTAVWMPSLAMCFLHVSLLSVTSTTVIFLLESGYSLRLITVAEGISAVFELSSTFLVAIAVGRLAEKSTADSFGAVENSADHESISDREDSTTEVEKENESRVDAAITRVGLWGIGEMVLILAPTVPILLYLTSKLPYPIPRSSLSPTFEMYPLLTVVLFFCLAASRLGRGTFALTTQQLAQTRVPSDQRSSFAGTEVGFVSLLGILHNLGTAIWSQPPTFGWLALGSFIAILSSASMYIWWLRRERTWYWRRELMGSQYSALLS